MNEQQKPKLPTPVRGDVFKARLDDAEGSEQSGTRPVVVVTRNNINTYSPVVVVVPITDASNVKKTYPGHAFLPKGSGGLIVDSIAKAEHIRAIRVARFVEYYGRLEQREMAEVDARIKNALALR